MVMIIMIIVRIFLIAEIPHIIVQRNANWINETVPDSKDPDV